MRTILLYLLRQIWQLVGIERCYSSFLIGIIAFISEGDADLSSCPPAILFTGYPHFYLMLFLFHFLLSPFFCGGCVRKVQHGRHVSKIIAEWRAIGRSSDSLSEACRFESCFRNSRRCSVVWSSMAGFQPVDSGSNPDSGLKIPSRVWKIWKKRMCFTIFTITKSEMEFLVRKGFKWGDDIHRTNSNRHTYYATESRAIKTTLENYRKNKTISA